MKRIIGYAGYPVTGRACLGNKAKSLADEFSGAKVVVFKPISPAEFSNLTGAEKIG